MYSPYIEYPMTSDCPRDTVSTNPSTSPFPGELEHYDEHRGQIVLPQTPYEFNAFVKRHRFPVAVFFANSKDPAMGAIMRNILIPALDGRQVVAIDVGIGAMSELSSRFRISGPTLMKFASGIPQRYFTGDLYDPIAVLAFVTSLNNWRANYSGAPIR